MNSDGPTQTHSAPGSARLQRRRFTAFDPRSVRSLQHWIQRARKCGRGQGWLVPPRNPQRGHQCIWPLCLCQK